MWIGNSEKNLHNIFELARRKKPCVLFFDEVDALGANRNEFIKFIADVGAAVFDIDPGHIAIVRCHRKSLCIRRINVSYR
ncbi:MAG: hypothetical protein RL234_1374, partial [Pseudomonadota bacterium]